MLVSVENQVTDRKLRADKWARKAQNWKKGLTYKAVAINGLWLVNIYEGNKLLDNTSQHERKEDAMKEAYEIAENL